MTFYRQPPTSPPIEGGRRLEAEMAGLELLDDTSTATLVVSAGTVTPRGPLRILRTCRAGESGRKAGILPPLIIQVRLRAGDI